MYEEAQPQQASLLPVIAGCVLAGFIVLAGVTYAIVKRRKQKQNDTIVELLPEGEEYTPAILPVSTIESDN